MSKEAQVSEVWSVNLEPLDFYIVKCYCYHSTNKGRCQHLVINATKGTVEFLFLQDIIKIFEDRLFKLPEHFEVIKKEKVEKID